MLEEKEKRDKMTNEYVIWDTESNRFIYGTSNRKNVTKDNIYLLQSFFRLIDGNHIQPLDGVHQHIGKTDINDKKIYDDCSIVEFDYLKDEVDIKRIGYFRFLAYYGCYQIFALDGNNDLMLPLEVTEIASLKIIDTIQENKLGLIK